MYQDRFILYPTQRQPELQPDSPIYVHCTRRCRDRKTGVVFLQVRMVNRSDSLVKTVVLRAEGLSPDGSVAYVCEDLILADCQAGPRQVFGEQHLLLIQDRQVQRVRVTVDRVVFEDGATWRDLAASPLVPQDQTRFKTCSCGMRNPPASQHCELCGRPFGAAPQDLDRLPPPEPPKMQPSLPPPPEPEEGEKDHSFLPWFLGVVLLLSLLAFVIYCVVQYYMAVK